MEVPERPHVRFGDEVRGGDPGGDDPSPCDAEDDAFVERAQRRRSRTVMNMGEAEMLHTAPPPMAPPVDDPSPCDAEDDAFVERAQRRRSRTVMNMGEAEMLHTAPPPPPSEDEPAPCDAEDDAFVERAQRRRSRTILSHDEARALHAAPEPPEPPEEGRESELHPIAIGGGGDEGGAAAWGEVHVQRTTCRPRPSKRLSLIEEDEELAELERARGVSSAADPDGHLDRLSTHLGPEIHRPAKVDEDAAPEQTAPTAKRRSSVGAVLGSLAGRLFRRKSSSESDGRRSFWSMSSPRRSSAASSAPDEA